MVCSNAASQDHGQATVPPPPPESCTRWINMVRTQISLTACSSLPDNPVASHVRNPTMLESRASSPPGDSAASTPAPPTFRITPPRNTPPPNRKRKHAAISGANSATGSPAPSDTGAVMQDSNGVVAANVHASASRPRLTVSRGPAFVALADGAIYHLTDQIANNHLGFRYTPAGLAEPGSKIAYRTIESRPPGYVRASWEDRNPFVKVTADGLGLCGEKGYRSARLNVPIREGNWYIEIKVEQGGGEKLPDSATKEGAHVRLGWSRRESLLNCPVGVDGYSYGFMDKNGYKVNLSRPRPYARPFGSGDVIGMYISLPPRRKPKPNDPYDPAIIKRERIAIEFKGQEYWESVEYPQSKEMMALMDSSANKNKDVTSVPSTNKKSATVKNVPERGRGKKPAPQQAPLQPLPTLRGSLIAFFINGEPQGIAFQDLYDYLQLRKGPSARKDRTRRRAREGLAEHTENPFDDGWLGYYPTISLFNGARVHINAGPDFDFPPPADIEGVLAGDPDSADTKTRTWRPICERYAEFMQEQWDLDAKEEEDAKAMALQREAEESKPTPPPPAPRKPPKSKPPQSRTPADLKLPADVKQSPVPSGSEVLQPSPLSQQVPQAPPIDAPTQPQIPVPPGTDPTSVEPEVTEAERKAQARRERKRELERARRAKQKEERLRLKRLEAEQKLASASPLGAMYKPPDVDSAQGSFQYSVTPDVPVEAPAQLQPTSEPTAETDEPMPDSNIDPSLT